jgi:hypothetical protein
MGLVMELKEITASDMREYVLGKRPVALMILESTSVATTGNAVSPVGLHMGFDGEPTWEDAAWQ